MTRPCSRSKEWHFEMFADFCRKVKEISGATPHLRTVGESCRLSDDKETAWRGGLYAATYNYPAAEAIWMNWQPEQVLLDSLRFPDWVKENWKGLPLRKERKAVNSPDRLSDCVMSYAEWQLEGGLKDMYVAANRSAYPFQGAWDVFTRCKFMGRYIAIRYLEFMRRYAHLEARMNDPRVRGGEHPRQGLHLLYPEVVELISKDTDAVVCVCETVFNKCLAEIKAAGVALTHYELQSLICEYKQAAIGKHQYPVQALDSELGYYHKVKSHFGEEYAERSQFFQSRSALFPSKALGEISGWRGKRKELGAVLLEHGYLWSDLLYDYKRTTDLSRPVRWGSYAETVSNQTQPVVPQGSLF